MTTTATKPPAPQPTRQPRIALAIATALIGVAVGAIAVPVIGRDHSSAAGGVDSDLFSSRHLVFRSLQPGADQGRISYVDADDPTGPRKVAEPRCLRVAAAAERVVCLRDGRNPAQPYEVAVLDKRLNTVGDEALSGVPSRARVAPDGKHYATTVFVSGHNYISLGFSTETVIYKSSGESVGNLEDFAFLLNGTKDESADRNIWGVTFAADSSTFFATVAVSGRTYLARGELGNRTLTALQENAECPSLSPDQSKVVYKKRVSPDASQAWRFHVLDLRTGDERPLGEERSVDDQVAWLDDEQVAYAVPKVTDGKTTADIWTAPVDGQAPRLLIPQADSPTLTGRPST